VNALELSDVSKIHPGTPPVAALRSVSLAVAAGELTAVIGPSGSGKSTLLALAGTLERPTSGTVRIAGQSVAGLSDRALSGIRAASIGFVFQHFFLLAGLSAADNVASGLLYHGLPVSERRAAATAALDQVGLLHRAGHRPAELSGGERQRVAIARALVGEPAIILADEPTGSLDTAAGAGIVAILSALNDRGVTILVVTHNPEIARIAHRTVRLRDGFIEHDTGIKRDSPIRYDSPIKHDSRIKQDGGAS
jgi:putative ABC transport system ATP-binding protein